MKDFLETLFSVDGEKTIFPLIPIMASTSRKVAPIKKTVLTRQKIRFHQPDEGFVEKCISTLPKSCFHFKILKSLEKTGVH